ncbi:MAG: hypothetical protein LUF86_04325 [Clostridiales bacterium]|nr:hypothetical protein [Clostridiales bacterium]
MGDYKKYIDILKIISEGGEAGLAILKLLDDEISMPNVQLPTMGGHVFWTNVVEYNGWRLQQNGITHHARILDNNDVRIAWGTMNGMYKVLDRLVESQHRYDNFSATPQQENN